MPVDYNKSKEKRELEKIFQNILLKYQWPMITMHFDQLTQEEKTGYAKALESSGEGIISFIQKRLDKETSYEGKYKVVFIPDTLFELAVMHVHIDGTTYGTKKDLRNDTYIGEDNQYWNQGSFVTDLEEKLKESLKEDSKKSNAERQPLSRVIRNSYEWINKNVATQELYFQTLLFFRNQPYWKDILLNAQSMGHEEYQPKDGVRILKSIIDEMIQHIPALPFEAKDALLWAATLQQETPSSQDRQAYLLRT